MNVVKNMSKLDDWLYHTWIDKYVSTFNNIRDIKYFEV